MLDTNICVYAILGGNEHLDRRLDNCNIGTLTLNSQTDLALSLSELQNARQCIRHDAEQVQEIVVWAGILFGSLTWRFGGEIHMIRSSFLVLAIATCALVPRAALAASADVQAERRSAAVMGPTMGIFFHELAHAMIGELGLPATGPEEDAADDFSAYIMGDMVRLKADPFLIDMVTYSSLHKYYSAKQQQEAGKPHPWRGEHAADIRRFRNSFCMLYGADSTLYGNLAGQFSFDSNWRNRCSQDYAKRSKAWATLMRWHARDLGPGLPGAHPANAPGGQIHLVFKPTYDRYGDSVKWLFNDYLGETLQRWSRYLVWPRDLLVEFRDCGEINAFYHPDSGTITMCYELVHSASQTVIQAEGIAALTPGERAMDFIQGVWWARVNNGSGILDITVTYSPDQTYHIEEIWAQSRNLFARVKGVWSAQLVGSNQLSIHRRPSPKDLYPREFCTGPGYCQRHVRQPANYPAQILDRNAMNVAGVVWRRIQ